MKFDILKDYDENKIFDSQNFYFSIRSLKNGVKEVLPK